MLHVTNSRYVPPKNVICFWSDNSYIIVCVTSSLILLVWINLFQDNFFSSSNVLPSTCKDVRKLLCRLGVDYKVYHTCQKHYILYKG